ncbi:hypothetical protein TNCV_3744191 [Trichonephila clavipes]|nr:hypothetical protein TNCV_3744191 [Trichonephila clavipes]
MLREERGEEGEWMDGGGRAFLPLSNDRSRGTLGPPMEDYSHKPPCYTLLHPSPHPLLRLSVWECVRFHILHGSHSVFGYPNNRVSERFPVPIDSDKRRSTVFQNGHEIELWPIFELPLATPAYPSTIGIAQSPLC